MTQSSWFEQHLALKTNPNHDDFNFTDSHCHLDFSDLSAMHDKLLSACQKQKINRLIIPSVAPDNWQKVLDVCLANKQANTSKVAPSKNNEGIKLLPALGIHPWYLQTFETESLEQLNKMVKLHRKDIVAIGETGLDGTIAEQQNNLKKQQYFFEYQISLANQYQLPMIIHHRKSHPMTAQMLKANPLSHGGVIHGFSGSYQQAKHYLDAGLLLGIGGTITYQRAKKTINTVKKLPLSSLMLETDAPSMPLQGHQGHPNSPLMVRVVFDALCLLRHEQPKAIAQQLEQNVERLFGH